MAFLQGLQAPQMVAASPMASVGAAQAGQQQAANRLGNTIDMSTVIDGTPVRVVVLALSAAAGLTALRMAGFKFNVAVSA